MTATSVLLLILSYISVVYSANILLLLSVGSRSNFIWNKVLIKGLALRGHNLTVLSADVDPSETLKNVHYIHLERAYDDLISSERKEEINEDLLSHMTYNQIQLIPLTHEFAEMNCVGVMKSKGLQTLVDYPDDFPVDLVIADFTLGACSLGFVHKFKYPPLIGVSPFNNPPHTVDLVGGHVYPAYIPFFSTDYSTRMSFFERIYNTVIYYGHYWYRNVVLTPRMDKLSRRFFPNMPYLGDLQNRAELLFVNSHPATHYPEPTSSNVIEVGGLHITEPKPLPQEMQKFVNSSRKGVVFISLGTNIKSEYIGSRRCKIFLEVIKEFPDYNFLWKIDSDFLEQSPPKNLLTSNWFPQRDILGHPRTKAFITHAGGLSTQESTWFGVPMIGLPVFVDQHRNLHRSITLGVALKVDLITMTKDKLYDGVKKILEDKTYSERMKHRSRICRDRPSKPLDTALWWIEYVLRNKKLEHFRSPTVDLGVIASNLFDVFAFILVSIAFCFVSCFYAMKKISNFFKSPKQKLKKEKVK